MLRGLLEAHDGTSGKELENQLFDYADSTASKDDGQAHELGKPIATPLLPAHRHCTHPGFTQQCCGLYHLITIWSIAMPRVIHFEIHADNTDRAAKFYTELFGWTFTKWGGPTDYWVVVTGPDGTPGINGGLMKRQHPISGNDGVIAYVCTVDVDNLDRFTAKAQQLGAPVALPKMPIPGIGWLAYMKDTEGNVFGMMQADANAK
jgi:predicted enzyme related to lactoylglutathione lyase